MVSQAVFIASLLTFIFSVLSALHWYWAFGGKWGLDGVVPSVDGKPTFSPGRLPTIVVACALLIAGLVCLWRVGVIAVGLPVCFPLSESGYSPSFSLHEQLEIFACLISLSGSGAQSLPVGIR